MRVRISPGLPKFDFATVAKLAARAVPKKLCLRACGFDAHQSHQMSKKDVEIDRLGRYVDWLKIYGDVGKWLIQQVANLPTPQGGARSSRAVSSIFWGVNLSGDRLRLEIG